ncbi:MAG: histidinol-phosphate transaminase [Spirochaetales bacterium]|nr:histidinol-phosphate transaminase [Spirochaetales bacterium]
MKELLRKNIATLKPYSSARTEFTGTASVYLDANEHYRDFVGMADANRYPDPRAAVLRRKLEEVLGLPFEHTVLGSGSDELIDNLIRAVCTPGKDSILILPPTYGAYKVFADINDVKVHEVPLLPSFEIDFPALDQFLSKERNERSEGRLKLLFLCSPNNPTGNSYSLETIEKILKIFDGLVVLDEAYYDFSEGESGVSLLSKYDHLVVLRTLSKAWGLASARVGIAVGSREMVEVINKIKYPYNLGTPSQALALKALENADSVKRSLDEIKKERSRLSKALSTFGCVENVYPSDANFLLLKVDDATRLYTFLTENGTIIRNRTKEKGLENCVRITVGSRNENDILLEGFEAYMRKYYA